MPFVPAFTTNIIERTTSPESLLGSLAGSLNLPVEEGAAALVWTNRDAISAQLVSKWPTLQFHLRRVGHLTDPIAADAKAVMLSVHKPLAAHPSNLVLARAVLLMATEGSMEHALKLIEAYDPMLDPGYVNDQDARIEALKKYWPGISPAVAGMMEDFPCIYSALARLINISKRWMAKHLGLGKSTVRDLMAGTMRWDENTQSFLIEQLGHRAQELRNVLKCDDEFMAAQRPALVGLAWQLWPQMQGWIEETAHWIQDTPDGDPRSSWKEGWEGFDPALNPEGFIEI